MRRIPFSLLLLFGGLLLSCERPLVEESPPMIEVLAPDFDEVFVDDQVVLRVKASSFRDVTRLEIGPLPMNYNQTRDEWEALLQLVPGPNIVAITATDEGNISRTDTLYAIYMPHNYVQGPQLETPVGHHASAITLLGTVWTFGGTRSENGPALDIVQQLPFGNDRFSGPEGSNMLTARLGHTATRLPDGRILLLGGSSTGQPEELSDLVATAEIFDPSAGTFIDVPFTDGNPIQRTFHTAVVRSVAGNTFVEVLGGRGNIGTNATPRMGTRSDLRSFLLRGDTLIAQTPNQGPFIEAIAEHTQTPLTGGETGLIRRYVVRSSAFLGDAREDIGFILDYGDPISLFAGPINAPFIPRKGHAGQYMRQGIVGFFGGRAGDPGLAVDTQELYFERADRFVKLPTSVEPIMGERFGLTATNYGATRILLIGGFDDDGEARPNGVFFDYTLN